MKLKTKFQDEDFELGEVVDATISTTSLVDTYIKVKVKAKQGGERLFCFSRISELFELFEDYEEPKNYWFITVNGEVDSICEEYEDEEDTEASKEIGNYFETKEEAEKAVEKLKAFKRLEDKGFRFTDYDYEIYGPRSGQVYFNSGASNITEIKKDLDLLFGGEE